MRLCAAVANVATVLDPEVIVFWGRVARAQPDLLPRVHCVAADIAPNCPEFRQAELGEDAAIHGCIRIALNSANESPHERLLNSSSAVA